MKLTVTDIATACHEVNRAFCLALGDDSQQPWPFAEAWQRDSAVKGVEFAVSGTGGPEAQHDAWTADKVARGWVYGPVKSAEAKTHPCLVPYAQLPIEQRAKDTLFIATVNGLKHLL